MSAHWYGNACQPTDIEPYEALLSTVPGGIVVTQANDDFTILFANGGYYELTGYEKEEHTRLFQNVGIATLHPNQSGRLLRDVRAQLRKTGAYCVKARLRHKQKGYTWVQLSGRLRVTPDGDAKIYSILVDVNDQMLALEKLEKEKCFHELIAELSEECFFDCDLPSGVVRYSENFTDKLGIEKISPHYIEAFRQLGLWPGELTGTSEGDLLRFLLDNPEREFRLIQSDGEEVWYFCRCSVLYDAEETPVRIIGKLTDITRHKLQIDELSHLAQRDQLTGLYNKTATESRIKETLKMRRLHDDKCVLMIVDIDNFKNINDRLGHLYGDAVLTQLAEHLKQLFRSDDVVGRVGGDEFFVFLKSYRTIDVVQAKAREICALFHKTYSEGDTFVTISASIGIALCPEDGMDFGELYKKADAALYDAKAAGKNTFSFYAVDFTHSYTSARTEIDTNTLKKSFKDNRIEYVFRLLYNSGNPVSSIQSVLQLVTESYGFSRGYIFETSADGQFTSNTFEWCAKGISAEIHNLQNLPLEAVGSANRAFLETGMFLLKSVSKLPQIEREVLEPQGIRSMFQFGIMDRRRLVGFIGFDDCVSERIPTDAEIDEICTVCHVLVTFLLKHRSGEREIRHHEAIEMVADHVSSFTYVIDPKTNLILYENRRIACITGKAAIGQVCHLAYHGRALPCENCPAKQIDSGQTQSVTELANEKYNLYLRMEATCISWSEDKQVILLCGTDISEYKKDAVKENMRECGGFR